MEGRSVGFPPTQQPKCILWRLPTPQQPVLHDNFEVENVESIRGKIRSRIRQRLLQAEAYRDFYAQFDQDNSSKLRTTSTVKRKGRLDDKLYDTSQQVQSFPERETNTADNTSRSNQSTTTEEHPSTPSDYFASQSQYGALKNPSTPSLFAGTSYSDAIKCNDMASCAEALWVARAKQVAARRSATKERLEGFLAATCHPHPTLDSKALVPGSQILEQALPITQRLVTLEHVVGTEGESTWVGHQVRKTKVVSPSVEVVVSTPASWGPYATSKHFTRVKEQALKQQRLEDSHAEVSELELMRWEDKYQKLYRDVVEAETAVQDLKEYHVYRRLYGHLPAWMLQPGTFGYTPYRKCYTRLPGRRYRRMVIRAALVVQTWWGIWIKVRRNRKLLASQYVQRTYRGHKGRQVYKAAQLRAERLQELLLQVKAGTKLDTFKRWLRYTKQSLAVKASARRIHIRFMRRNFIALHKAVREQYLDRQGRFHILSAQVKLRSREEHWKAWKKLIHDEKLLRNFLAELATRTERRAFVTWIQFTEYVKRTRVELATLTILHCTTVAKTTVAQVIAAKRAQYYRDRAIRLQKAHEIAVLIHSRPIATNFVNQVVVPRGLSAASKYIWLARHRNICANRIKGLFIRWKWTKDSFPILEAKIGKVIHKRWDRQAFSYYYVNSANGERHQTRLRLLDRLSERQGKRLDCLTPVSRRRREEKQVEERIEQLESETRTDLEQHVVDHRWLATKRLEDWGTEIDPFTLGEMEAGRKIQSLVRCFIARRRITELCKSITEKAWDPTYGAYYFVNKRTGETTWDAPTFYEEDNKEPKKKKNNDLELHANALKFGPYGMQTQMVHQQQLQLQQQMLKAQMFQNQLLQAQLMQQQQMKQQMWAMQAGHHQ